MLNSIGAELVFSVQISLPKSWAVDTEGCMIALFSLW